MALICPTCRTENRDAAKFCKGCGGKLVSLPPRSAEEAEALDDAWGATVVASLDDDPALPPPPAPPRASRPSALHTASSDPSAARTARPHRLHRAPPRRDRSAFWVLLAAATIVVATGGLYVYRGQHRTPLLTVVQDQGPAAPGSPVAPAATPKPTASPITGPVTTTEAAAPATPAPTASAAAVPSPVAAARKPRKVASAPVAAPPPPVTAAPVAPVVPAPEPVAPPPPADPSQACASRGFFATSQCLVVQCAKPEFSGHARCEAVRQQQRIDEEKRNPTNAA